MRPQPEKTRLAEAKKGEWIRKSGMSAKEELSLLKARAQEISVRLDQLNRRIHQIRQEPERTGRLAVVDAEKCLGCGLCASACPVEAITIQKAASVNPDRCIGCGRCVGVCPQNAMALRLRISKPAGQTERPDDAINGIIRDSGKHASAEIRQGFGLQPEKQINRLHQRHPIIRGGRAARKNRKKLH